MEQQASPLTQLGAMQASTPSPVTDPQGALNSMMMEGMKKKQSYLEQQQAAYNAEMEKYAQMVAQSQQPESSEAGRWGAIAGGFSSVAPTWGNIGGMLGRGGAEYGKFIDQNNAQDLKAQGDLTKLRQAEVRALESKDQAVSLQKALLGKGFEFRQNADHTTTVFSRDTGFPVGTYGPKDIAKLASMAQMLTKEAMDKNPNLTMEQATEWAQKQAISQITALNEAAGNATPPMRGDVGGLKANATNPAVAGIPPVQAAPTKANAEELGKVLAEETRATASSGDPNELAPHVANLEALKAHIATLAPQDRADVDRNFQRYMAQPNAGTLRGLETSLSRVGALTPQPTISASQAKAAGEKKTAEKTAESYEGMFTENVAKPAAAFANTGKIMQDFNVLGQMNYALKNGKLKEFMAGEPGKYALSFLPENSDLRKGIANAQEAEKLTAGMVNQILLAAKGVQTEGDAQRARSQVTSIGTDPDANAYLEAYINETARQLKMRELAGRAHKNATGTFEGYDDAWGATPLMKEARGSVKKLGSQWIGATQYIEKFKAKNPGATDSDAVQSWNRVK